MDMINESNFESIVMKAGSPVLVGCINLEFGSGNQINAMKTAEVEQKAHVRFCLVGTDYLRRFMERFFIAGTPTYLIFENGIEKGLMMGEADSRLLEFFLKRTFPHLYPESRQILLNKSQITKSNVKETKNGKAGVKKRGEKKPQGRFFVSESRSAKSYSGG
jgi:hypothetical protein